jgi:hypothetical protein
VDRPAIMERICDAIDTGAPRDGVVVISGESYEHVFHHSEPETLVILDAFSLAHDMRVAYYVRPQDSWLRSAWLQWGFRAPLAPDEWVRWNRQRINYVRTLMTVKAGAPHLCFEMRPFRTDLLIGGTVVSDFAYAFLSLRDLECFARETHMNQSMPLEVAILLRDAPPGMFWADDDDDHDAYDRLKEIILAWKIPETEAAARSQRVLRHYAHETYEPGNRHLIELLGWQTDYFVPPVEGAATTDELHLLNELWKTTTPLGERQLIYTALERLLAAVERNGQSQAD